MRNIVKRAGIIAIMVILGFSLTTCADPELPILSGNVSISGIAQVGQILTAKVNLNATGDINFQWKRGNDNIGVNSDTYPVQAADAGAAITVTVTLSGFSGSVTSDSITIDDIVNAQTPIITIQPVDGTMIFGGTHNLSVTANITDGGTLTYRWFSNTSASNIGGTPIEGATSATYNPPTNAVGTFFYFVEVTNTIADNGDGGNKTAMVRSTPVTLIVESISTTTTIPGSNVELTMVRIPAGNFVMGSPVDEPGRWSDNENPRTANGGVVTMSGFWIGRYPVTHGNQFSKSKVIAKIEQWEKTEGSLNI